MIVMVDDGLYVKLFDFGIGVLLFGIEDIVC